MTFSLIARCAHSGMVGGVVTTSSPAVGARCLHTAAGVGAVLTQFWTDPRLGPRGLALLAEGCPAPHTVAALVSSTPENEWRQLAAIDAQGRTAHFSGARIRPHRNEAEGPDCVAIGNILANDTVPGAMVQAFAASDAAFPERLLAALDAGLAAGGEDNPLVSAALRISWRAPFPYADLRVDMADRPLVALRALWQAYAPVADLYLGRAVTPDAMEPPAA